MLYVKRRLGRVADWIWNTHKMNHCRLLARVVTMYVSTVAVLLEGTRRTDDCLGFNVLSLFAHRSFQSVSEALHSSYHAFIVGLVHIFQTSAHYCIVGLLRSAGCINSLSMEDIVQLVRVYAFV